jgi:DNA polymerase III delta prime subunit
MQLRHLYLNDPQAPETFALDAPDQSGQGNPFVGAFGTLPDAFLPTDGTALVLRFFFEAWQRRLPDPVPVSWICGPSGTGKTSLLSALAHGLEGLNWPPNFSALDAQFNALRASPPHLLMLSAQQSKTRFGVEPLAMALLRAFNGEQGYAVSSIEIAALEHFLDERQALESFAHAFHARTATDWQVAREGANVLREDLIKALSAALNEPAARAEKDYEAAIAKPHDPANYLLNQLMRQAEREGPQQRVLVLIDDVDQLFNGDQTLMRDALALLSRFACDSHGRIACAVSARLGLSAVLSDWADWVPAGVHSVALGPKDALALLYARWLHPNVMAAVSLAALAPEATHPFSSSVLDWLSRILAAQPDIHVLTLLAEVLKANAQRAAVDLLGPAALIGPLYSQLPSATARLLQDTLVDLPPAQAELLAALALAPLGGTATLSEAELAQLAQPRLGETVIPSGALSALEKAGWLRRLEGGVALNLPESQVRQSVGEQLSLSLRERMRLLAELLFEHVLQSRQTFDYRNGRPYAYNRLCDSHAHGSASHELALMLLTPLAPEYADFDEFHAVLRSAEGGGQALLKLGAVANLSERLAMLSRARHLRSQGGAYVDRALETELLEDLAHAFENAEVFVAGRRLTMTAIEPAAVVDSAVKALIESVHTHVDEVAHHQSEALAMIRVVLGGRELPAGENIAALQRIDAYFELHLAQMISMGDLVQRFRQRPFGWPELEIVLLAARLVGAGKLSVRLDGHSARPAESAEAFTNAALWPRVGLVRAPLGVTDDMLGAAQLGHVLFARNFSLENASGLANALRAELDAWRNELTAMASPNAFAGSHDAREALSELKQLTLLREGDEFLRSFCAQNDVLSDIGADLAELRSARAQLGPVYDLMRKTLVEIQPNVSALRRDQAASNAIDRLQVLQSAHGQRENSDEITRLCELIGARNFALIADGRDLAIARIELAHAEVSAQLDTLDASDDVRQRSLAGLKTLQDQVDLEVSHAALLGLCEEAANDRDSVLERLNRQITSERPAVGDQQLLLTVVRPGRLAGGMVIEQEADLDVYFDKIRLALAPMLKAGMRVRLE